MKTLERCFNDCINTERGNIVETFEVRIQNANLTAIDTDFIPKSELIVRSINTFLGQNGTGVTTISERGERARNSASSQNVLFGQKNLEHTTRVKHG